MLSFAGALDERATLPVLANTRANVIILNMKKVSGINSAGVRNWVN